MLAESRNNLAVLAVTGSFLAVAVSVFVTRSGSPLLLLAALVLPILLLVFIKSPYVFSVGLYAFFLPFDSIIRFSGSSADDTASFTKYLGALCILVLVFKGMADRRFRRPDAATLWWVVFIAFAIFSSMWAMSLNMSAYITRTGTALSLLLLYLAVSVYPVEEGEYEALKKFIMYGGLAAAGFTMYVYRSILQSGSGEVIERVTLATTQGMTDPAQMTDPNQFAFSLLIPFGIAFHQMLKARSSLNALFYAAIFAALVYMFVISGSRGGALGAVIILAVLLYYSARRGRALLAALVFTAMFVYFAPENYFQRITTVAYETGGAGRLDIWKVGMEAFRHNWVFGVGLDNFPNAYDYYSYAAPHAKFEGYGRAGHSIFLVTVVELGVVGALVIFFSLLGHYRLTGRSKKVSSDQALLKAIFLGTLAQAATLDVIWRKSFWLLFMLVVIHNIVESRRKKNEPDSPVAHVPV
jgi:O-antigen ligase